MTPYVFCHLSLQSISQINLNGVRWNLKQDFPDALKYARKLKFKFIPVYYKVYFETRILKDILGMSFFSCDSVNRSNKYISNCHKMIYSMMSTFKSHQQKEESVYA